MADTIFLDHPASGILLEPEGEVHGWFATSQDHALRIRINGQDVEPFLVNRPDVQAAHLTARTGGFGISYGPFEGEGRIELQIGDASAVLDFRQREGTRTYDPVRSHADHRYRTPIDLRVTEGGAAKDHPPELMPDGEPRELYRRNGECSRDRALSHQQRCHASGLALAAIRRL